MADDIAKPQGERDPPATGPEDEHSSRSLLPTLVVELLQLGGFFYALGFLVILVHTIRLHVPVIEALRIQNLLAGLPVGGVMLPAYWATRPLTREIAKRGSHAVAISWIFVTVVLLSVPLLVGEILLILPGLSASTTVLIVLALPPAVSLYFLVLAYRQKFPLGKATSKVMCVYALLIALAGGYAWFFYPHLPQSFGGGRPEKVTLYIKPGELPLLLGTAGTANDRVSESFPAYVYYRTSNYLLISKDQNADQPLVQIPLDLVRAIAWMDSRSK